jgi:ribosomal protein L11 methyltransferase
VDVKRQRKPATSNQNGQQPATKTASNQQRIYILYIGYELMNWLELSVQVDRELVEPVSELFGRYGYNGGVAIDEPFSTNDETMAYRKEAARPVVVRTYLAADASAEERQQRIAQGLWHLGQIMPVGELHVKAVADEDWANAWKQHYTITRLGERTVIVPSWLEYEARDGDVVLHLDPGMAFGTGTHPTTQLCLALLESYVGPQTRALDLGCGSGILAIAAAKLGAQSVLALDTDPVAIQATQENVARNGVAATVHAAVGSLGAGVQLGHWLGWEQAAGQQVVDAAQGSFELIVANIIAKVLATIAPDLAGALLPGGILLSSGIIAEREPEVLRAYSEAGLRLVERRLDGDWVALVHTR